MSELETPLVAINFKAYPQGIGKKSVELAEIISSEGRRGNVGVAVAPQYADLYRVTSQVDVPTLAQHMDPLKPGTGTGWLLPEAAREAGAVGSLINHSDRRLDSDDVKKIVARLRDLDLVSMVCAKDPQEAKRLAAFGPDMLAVEPPELIGSGRAVSKVKPDVVEDAVNEVQGVDPEIEVLCGAGVSNGEDVKVALELGAKGVLIASAVVKAEDPRVKMRDLVEGVHAAGKG